MLVCENLEQRLELKDIAGYLPYELKIDYRGLIDVGLAIDVNTLDFNPYK